MVEEHVKTTTNPFQFAALIKDKKGLNINSFYMYTCLSFLNPDFLPGDQRECR